LDFDGFVGKILSCDTIYQNSNKLTVTTTLENIDLEKHIFEKRKIGSETEKNNNCTFAPPPSSRKKNERTTNNKKAVGE